MHTLLQSKLQNVVAAIIPDADLATILIRPCPDPKFGDYQTNALIALAKQRGLNPRQLASEVVAKLDVSELCDPIEIAGPGFLNFRLKSATLTSAVAIAVRGESLFFTRVSKPRTFVVDFSSPNVAKPMHVGHIRSTGIGDVLVRVLRLLGHRVITDNHIGDWGTQFGMLLLGWKTRLDQSALQSDPLAELERLYREVNAVCDPDKPGFNPAERDSAKAELVKLQAGDPENLAIWKEMLRLSQLQFDAIYTRLSIRFDHSLGESFYNEWLPGIVTELLENGIARRSEDAVAAFSDTIYPDDATRPAPKENPFLVNRDGKWIDDPALIQKSDGGFNYMTTDLATVRHRMQRWKPDEIVYVVDDRQSGHFKKLFAVVRRWMPQMATTRLTHVGFGKICGADKKPLKTRDGSTPKLAALLDEAEERALAAVTELRPELGDADRRSIARVVGVGALRYQDLLPNRDSDYVFSWEKMLSLNGNTAPYLQYAYTRIRSILRKAEAEGISVGHDTIELSAPEELSLARHLLNFGLVLESVAEDYRPNYLCNYLFELAGHYSKFYEACPVLKSEGKVRTSRLALCDATGQVLKLGLATLGIETLEQM